MMGTDTKYLDLFYVFYIILKLIQNTICHNVINVVVLMALEINKCAQLTRYGRIHYYCPCNLRTLVSSSDVDNKSNQ